MKPTELHVGNIVDVISRSNAVHLPTMGVGYRVYEIQFSGVVVYLNGKKEHELTDEDRFFIPYRDLEGMRLTQAWLERFGFEKDGEYGWYRKEFTTDNEMVTEVNEISVNVEVGRCSISFVGYVGTRFKKPSNVYTGRSINYVHQLQNLYQALTLTDLTLKD